MASSLLTENRVASLEKVCFGWRSEGARYLHRPVVAEVSNRVEAYGQTMDISVTESVSESAQQWIQFPCYRTFGLHCPEQAMVSHIADK